MSRGDTPAWRVKYKVDNVVYSVVTVWRSERGGFSVSIDKHSEKYPAMNPAQVLSRWFKGDGFLNIYDAGGGGRSDSGRSSSGGGDGKSNGGWGGDDFGDDIPF